MTGFLHVFVILFTLSCLLLLCEGKVSAPSAGPFLTFAPGSTGRISWSFDDVIKLTTRRIWSFTPSNGQPQVTLALIDNDDPAKIFTNLLDFAVEKPATLVLKNVNLTYNGTYQFTLSPSVGEGISEVVVYIAVTPQVKVGCYSLSTVNVTDNFTCLCEASGGNPTAYVTWYKGNKKIGESRKEEQTLRLINVDRNDVGIYKCEAKSHDSAINRTEIELIVNYKPYNTRIIFIPTPAIVGNLVEIKCDSEGVPDPHFIIIRDSEEIGTGKSHVIPKLKPSDEGTYTCIAINLLGNDSATKNLNETAVKPTVSLSCPNRNEVNEGDDVICVCKGEGGVPAPANVTWYEDGVKIGETKKENNTLTLTDVNLAESGTYTCVAQSYPTEAFTDEKSIELVVKCNCQTFLNDNNSGIEWYIVISLVSGIIIGIIFSYIVRCSYRRWFRNGKPERNPELRATELDSTYHELDLTKLKAEDNYQSLRVNAASNDTGNDDDSTYTELNKTRDVENNYQSLS